MKYREVKMGSEARETLMKGVNQVYEPVSRTMGAAGKNGAYNELGEIRVTNDGVSIARQVMPLDPFERIGANLVKQAAERTVSEAGDGTTGTIVLARTMLDESFKLVNEGKNPMVLRKELEYAKNQVVKVIQDVSKPVKDDDELLGVAKISVEDEGIAKTVTDAVKKAGTHGAVVVEEGSSYWIETEEVKGYFWNKGYVSPYMVNSENRLAVLPSPIVIVTDKYMNQNLDLIQVINTFMGKGERNFLLIADKVEGELLGTLVMNKLQGRCTIVAVQKPGTSEELEDIAILVGGTAVTKDKGIKTIETFHCGRASKVIVKEDKTTIIAESTPALIDRVNKLAQEIKEKKDDDLLKERKAKLSDGMVMLRVGAKTESEKKYLKDKVDDAVSAVKAAMEEGIVEGAGATLFKVINQISDDTDGGRVMCTALLQPYKRILENAGLEANGKYYDVLTGKEVKDLFKAQIIDPTKVVRCMVENATAFARNALTIESLVAEKVVTESTPSNQG